jgi:hypothetical protein
VLWHLRPTTRSSVLPFGKINGRVLEIAVESPLDEQMRTRGKSLPYLAPYGVEWLFRA